MHNLERFINYVKINTQSSETTGLTPSTECQKDLGTLLVSELQELGLEDAHMDEWGNVYGHLPGKGTKIGLNAHMDTALEVTGSNVSPRLIKNYRGGTIKLANGLEMNPTMFPSLTKHVGHDLIVTDGNTLLGADDKAGIAIIMSVLQYFHDNPKAKHNTICVAFTVDEEIGEGALHFNYKKMDAKYAYTIDGSDINVIDYENFNAYAADINVKGVSIHPGEGKDKLINALLVINKVIEKVTLKDTPFESEGKQGFFHVTKEEGTSEEASAHMIIRDFKDKGMNARMQKIEKTIADVKKEFPGCEITVSFKKQYENMRQYVCAKPIVVKRARKAMRKNGVNSTAGEIRGGTDGATFSKNGLITPNLGTGSHNHHGRYEYLDVQEFEKMINIVKEIVKK